MSTYHLFIHSAVSARRHREQRTLDNPRPSSRYTRWYIGPQTCSPLCDVLFSSYTAGIPRIIRFSNQNLRGSRFAPRAPHISFGATNKVWAKALAFMTNLEELLIDNGQFSLLRARSCSHISCTRFTQTIRVLPLLLGADKGLPGGLSMCTATVITINSDQFQWDLFGHSFSVCRSFAKRALTVALTR